MRKRKPAGQGSALQAQAAELDMTEAQRVDYFARQRKQRKGNGGTPPRIRGGKGPTPSAIVEQRVLQVVRLLSLGQRTADVRRALARAQDKEAKDRTAAADPKSVAYVWGDSPLPDRNVDRLIARAKEQLRVDARALPQSADYILGMQWSRLNELYAAARADRKYSICLGIIETVNAMFGLNAAIKLQFGAQEADATLSHLPIGRITAEQARTALTDLMGSLEQRGQSLLPSPLPAPLDPARSIDAEPIAIEGPAESRQATQAGLSWGRGS